jgi:DnaJ-class molecular chaperone
MKTHMVKCSCPECHGTGSVPCPECNGNGHATVPISSITVHKGHPNYDELMLLKQDAQRIEFADYLDSGKLAAKIATIKSSLDSVSAGRVK